MSTKKTYFTVFAVVAALSVAVPLLVVHKPWRGTKVETSELYNRYADKEGIEASFIKDYRVNDSIFVDVTVLEAMDDTAWAVLLKDFNMDQFVEQVIRYDIKNDVFVWLAPRKDYTMLIDSVMINNDVLSISISKKEICVFSIETEDQMKAVSFKKYDESVNKNMFNSKNKKNEQNN
jgi:hypothetical protein